jgi:hypothetical protein
MANFDEQKAYAAQEEDTFVSLSNDTLRPTTDNDSLMTAAKKN